MHQANAAASLKLPGPAPRRGARLPRGIIPDSRMKSEHRLECTKPLSTGLSPWFWLEIHPHDFTKTLCFFIKNSNSLGPMLSSYIRHGERCHVLAHAAPTEDERRGRKRQRGRWSARCELRVVVMPRVGDRTAQMRQRWI